MSKCGVVEERFVRLMAINKGIYSPLLGRGWSCTKAAARAGARARRLKHLLAMTNNTKRSLTAHQKDKRFSGLGSWIEVTIIDKNNSNQRTPGINS